VTISSIWQLVQEFLQTDWAALMLLAGLAGGFLVHHQLGSLRRRREVAHGFLQAELRARGA
jgi:hypothetical protein